MTVVAQPRAIGAPVDRIEGRAEGHRRGALRLRDPVEGVAYAVARAGRRSPRAGSLDVDAERGARAARRARRALARATRRALADARTTRDLASSRSRRRRLSRADRRRRRRRDASRSRARPRASSRVALRAAAARRRAARGPPGDLYAPDKVNPAYETDTQQGDVDAALGDRRRSSLDATYTTPADHNNPMEPHAALAVWDGGDAARSTTRTRARRWTRDDVATVFGLPPERVRVISAHVGGGFGSKGLPRPTVVLAALAARRVGRPVKVAAHAAADVRARPATARRRSSACGSAPTRDGRLTAIVHDVVEQTSTLKEFAEQTAVADAHDVRGAQPPHHAPARRGSTCRRRRGCARRASARGCSRWSRPWTSWRSPAASTRSSCASATSPTADPESGHAVQRRATWSRACARAPSASAGQTRDPTPGPAPRRALAASAPAWRPRRIPACRRPPARRRARGGRRAATPSASPPSDIGTGALDGAHPDRGRRARRAARARAAWRSATARCRRRPWPAARWAPPRGAGRSSMPAEKLRARLRAEHGGVVPPRARGRRHHRGNPRRSELLARTPSARSSPRSHVDADTGEVRVPRLLGVFAAGRIINPKTARSQFLGGMTMGLSMALHEESVLDPRFGDYLNTTSPGTTSPPTPTCGDIEAVWIDEDDDARQPHGLQGHRRDRHRGHRGGDRQRRLQRDRRADQGPADHAGPAA